MKPLELFKELEKKFREAGIESPRSLLFHLFRDLLEIPENKILLNEEIYISPTESEKLASAVERLLAGEPLDYVIGWKKFLNIYLKVDRRVLIPRPETEELVEKVIKDCHKKCCFFADIGTGSGAIALVIAKTVPDSIVYATDVSKEALELAIENARINGIKNVRFLWGEYLLPIQAMLDKIEVIISNPPYIKSNLISNLEIQVRKYEPLVALDGGSDGMDFYREFLKQLPSGKKVYLEIADYTAESLEELVKQHRKDYHLCIERDMYGFRRYAILTPVALVSR
ncbi:peptide chain release factor N(5)-glutamine methyltransferase [Kosmotoga pacifica]|uniref:peptide chain release factor N(5)-glutamine methyltransferase n=2 Tax=Kosmotoga pacifica TaxID=1330330 RepID=A0A0G2ZGT4_9BACT|nr:peptide chain release factor N(5)-glutamine methyltransferase [Kosmotoga pacifica]AKI97953.1 hypothetical protein IX53_09100 [Kosmotoga pacifica]